MANPWTAFYWDKYERRTADLSMIEHGAYFLLLKYYYCNGGPISANADRLLVVCRAFAEPERQAVLSVLKRFFVLDGDVYRHAECDEQLSKASEISEKRRVAGQNGAEIKRSKRQANATAIANANAYTATATSTKEEKRPEGLSLRELAHGICQIAKLPATNPNLDVVQAAMEIKPADELRDAVERAVSEGKTLNRFWFENGGFNEKAPEPPKPKPIPLHLKVRAEMEAERREKAAARVN